MIKAIRITVSGSVPHENVTIYDVHESINMPFPNLFEESQMVIMNKHGTFMLPDYNVIVIQLKRGRVTPPVGSYKIKRVVLSEDIIYQDCYIVDQGHWHNYGIPQLFKIDEQLAFICKDGLFICPDFSVQCLQVE
jgi:hypothetical protein